VNPELIEAKMPETTDAPKPELGEDDLFLLYLLGRCTEEGLIVIFNG